MPTPNQLHRDEKLRLIAAGSPVSLPAGMLDAALASDQSATDFALAVADHAVTEREAEGAREREIEQRVARIVNSDAPAASFSSADPAVELAARRILEA